MTDKKTKVGFEMMGLLVMVLTMAPVLIGCPTDNTPAEETPVEETFTVTAGGTTYTLKVTDNTTYVLTVGAKTSSGTATKTANGYTLKPSNSDTTFTVTTSGSGITAMSGTITFDDGTTAEAPATLQVPSAGDEKGIVVIFEDDLLEPEEYPDEEFAILVFADHNTYIPASGQGSQGYSNVVSVSAPGPQIFTWEIKPPAGNYYIALAFATRYSMMWYKPNGGPLTTIPINSSGETSAGALSTDDFGYKD